MSLKVPKRRKAKIELRFSGNDGAWLLSPIVDRFIMRDAHGNPIELLFDVNSAADVAQLTTFLSTMESIILTPMPEEDEYYSDIGYKK